MLKIANAPCSWGTLEFEDVGQTQLGYTQMLDELVETGYIGTDLGDWGFMPTEPEALRQALIDRELTMISAYIGLNFKNPFTWAEGQENVLKTAKLLAAVADIGDSAHQPMIVLADDNGTDPVRTKNAGRIRPEQGLSPAEWRTFAQGVEQVAQAVRDETGLHCVFHPHCAGYVETPAEIDRLMDLTTSDLVGFIFDTGHFLYGTGQNDSALIQSALDTYAERIWLVHYKDCHPDIATQARVEGWDYFQAVGQGVFCELGQGAIDFAAVTEWLSQHPNLQRSNWLVVEQDVLPGMGSPKESARRNREFLRNLGL